MSLFDRLIAASIGFVPRSIVKKVAARYVAGETLADALAAGEALSAEGCRTTYDLLGEFVRDEAQADATADAYLELLEALAESPIPGNASIKLTAFGLMLDAERTYARVRRVVARAKELGQFVRLDMEDSPWTDQTFAIHNRLRDEGLDNVGVVVQAYLKRTLDDVERLSPRNPSYRLCKGIYVEPEEIAYKDRERIRENFLAILERMLTGASRHVGIATHDEVLVDGALKLIEKHGIGKDRYEFQMLLGVTEPLRRRVIESGHPLRVYVPYGADWYGYCTRRLKENPAIGRHVFLALFKRR